jgi:hypothetical protein
MAQFKRDIWKICGWKLIFNGFAISQERDNLHNDGTSSHYTLLSVQMLVKKWYEALVNGYVIFLQFHVKQFYSTNEIIVLKFHQAYIYIYI